MRYESKADTFQVRQVTEAELIEDGSLTAGEDGAGEFRVRTSPVGNGWWTRAELVALHDKLGALLALPVARQRFCTGDPADEIATTPEDAARRRGYLAKDIPDATVSEIRAAVAAMLADRAAGVMRAELPEDQIPRHASRARQG